MITFTELRFLCAESILLKYVGYVFPLLLLLFIKRVWKRFTSTPQQIQNEVNDIDDDHTIQTDSNDNPNDFEYKPHLPERDHVPYCGIAKWLDKSGDQFYQLVNDRRSIRKFAKDKPVDIQVIEKCVLAAGKLRKH